MLDENGNAMKEIHNPEQGEVVDRYGPANGRYTSLVIDGKPYNMISGHCLMSRILQNIISIE
ncbi:hypothetical protein MLOOGBEN_18990 [Bacillus sp. EB106-08-02-XG196]|uniref:hypothetical protein n=1 Tax=Bacillus sp. EB106-08-02-XG196 TaxID=2737049 RepID=UPI0015C4B0E2|nr:hypothetical protein [Bacillus sp. EB106-08-02-XG196]NWQ42793.1 hypothetical protein [Bacillus sp. EB106-08-02-XG196]